MKPFQRRVLALSLVLALVWMTIGTVSGLSSSAIIPRPRFPAYYFQTTGSTQKSHEGAVDLGLGVEVFQSYTDQQSGLDHYEIRAGGVASSRGLKTYTSWDESGTPAFSTSPTYFSPPSIIWQDDGGLEVDVDYFVKQCWPTAPLGNNRIDFYGVHYQRLWISMNGFLFLAGQYLTIDPPYYPYAIPSPADLNGFIAPFWTDLERGTGNVQLYCYSKTGTGNWDDGQSIGIMWDGVRDKHGIVERFAVQFTTPDLNPGHWWYQIHFLYWTVSTSQPVTIGIENEVGTKGFSGGSPRSNHMVHWTNDKATGYSFLSLTVGAFKPTSDNSQVSLENDPVGGEHTIAGLNVALVSPETNPYADRFQAVMDAALLVIGIVAPELAPVVILIGAGEVIVHLYSAYLAPAAPNYVRSISVPNDADGRVYATVLAGDERGPVFCDAGVSTCATDITEEVSFHWVLFDSNRRLDHALTFYVIAYYTPDVHLESRVTLTTSVVIVKRQIGATINLYPPSMGAHDAVLTWDQYTGMDFNGYDVFYHRNKPGDDVTPVYRATIKSQTIACSAGGLCTFDVTGLDASTPYCFILTNSQERCGTTLPEPPPPPPPPIGGTPYLDVLTASGYVRDNNILSPAHQYRRTNTKVTDYSLVQHAPAISDSISLRVKAEGRETSILDQVQLLGIDHPSTVNISVSDDGRITTYGSLRNPISAASYSGRNVVSFLNRSDGNEWPFEAGSWADVTFSKNGLDMGKGADIIILCNSCGKLGEPPYPPGLSTRYKAISPAGPLRVFGLNPSGSWILAGSPIPRMYQSRYAVNLSAFLTGAPQGNFTIRFSSTAFHEIDYIGLDNSINAQMTTQTAPLLSAIVAGEANITPRLRADDNSTAVLRVGGTLNLKFGKIPNPAPGTVRDYVFVSKGYFYPLFTEPDAFQNVRTRLSLTGTAGSAIATDVSVNTKNGSYTWNETVLNKTALSTDTATFSFSSYANRSYRLEVVYIAKDNSSSNSLNINLLFGSQNVTISQSFAGRDGRIQYKLIDLDQYLHRTLNATAAALRVKLGESVVFEPINLIPDGDWLGWAYIIWTFGDGSSSNTTSRTATKTWSISGTYTLSVRVVYTIDGALVDKTATRTVTVTNSALLNPH